MTHELLTVDEMANADRLTINGGIPGLDLMEAAGQAIAEAAARLATDRPILCLCGPGNNGGDGYVAARILKNHGATVTIAALGNTDALTGDARTNFERWDGETRPLDDIHLTPGTVIIDALFGAGLQRNIEGKAAHLLEQAKDLALISIAADLPSGVNGDTGQVMGTALPATETVTFFRKKPGHLLFPGRELCGRLSVVDIGIPARVLTEIKPKANENLPAVWGNAITAQHSVTAHKYNKGHVVIFGGAEMTGAARLAARGARRAGAGLVTLAVPETALDVYRSGDPGNIIEQFKTPTDTLEDPRRNTTVVGPGLGVSQNTLDIALNAITAPHRTTVLDADGLSVFTGKIEQMRDAAKGPTILTPHEGEFARLFAVTGDKLSRARIAARDSGCVIVLKGADTVIAAPDGRAFINTSAPPWLGTAGAGDVLAGIIAGFAAQGVPAYEAAAAGVWCHGIAAASFGPGLIAEDLPALLPNVLHTLFQDI